MAVNGHDDRIASSLAVLIGHSSPGSLDWPGPDSMCGLKTIGSRISLNGNTESLLSSTGDGIASTSHWGAGCPSLGDQSGLQAARHHYAWEGQNMHAVLKLVSAGFGRNRWATMRELRGMDHILHTRGQPRADNGTRTSFGWLFMSQYALGGTSA